MGRVINPESSAKERTQLIRSVVLALRELMRQTETTTETRDLAAYIVLALEAVDKTVETSVAAWEKRDYWVKADRFRMDWAWAGRSSQKMRKALLADDWPAVAMSAALVAEKLKDIELPKRNTLGSPWQGAMTRLQNEK